MRLLCVSDIHGHEGALAAVLATAERHGYSQLLVAGDLCFPGPKPLETWRRLMQAKAICVQGITDRALATLDVANVRPRSDHERERLQRLGQVRAELGDLILSRIARLPPIFRMPLGDGGELVVVHGSPADPLEPITHDMSDDEVMALLGDDPADVVICGGSHVPFDRTVAGVRIINVGSVGEAPNGADGEGRAPNHVTHAADVTDVTEVTNMRDGGAPVQVLARSIGTAGAGWGHAGGPAVPGRDPLVWSRHADATFLSIHRGTGHLEVEQIAVPLGKSGSMTWPAKAVFPQE